MYTEGVGWNWHKSWNIPEFTVEIILKDPETDDGLIPPEKMTAELNIVKPIINEISSFHLLDVGVKGCNKIELENGRGTFSGLKFDTTSYNHDVCTQNQYSSKHAKFHFVITIYINATQFQYPQIIDSQISPPIFVDSRKTARDNLNQKQYRIQFNPFNPEMLEKSYYKRDSKVKGKNEEEICPDISGFLKYFGAANIRNKVKHPLFLALKFYQCIFLYVNLEAIHLKNPEKIIEFIQFSLINNQEVDKKDFIVVVDSNNELSKSQLKMRKIKEYLEPLNHENIKIMIDPVSVPKNYQKISMINELQNAYKSMYPRLISQQFTMGINRQKQQDQEYAEESEIRNGMTISKVIVIQGASNSMYILSNIMQSSLVKKKEEFPYMKYNKQGIKQDNMQFDEILKNENESGE